MELEEMNARARQAADKRAKLVELLISCTNCGLPFPESHFYKRTEYGRQSVCKMCRGAAKAFCGCGCGRWPVGDMLYFVRVNLKPKQVGTYFKSQKCADKVFGIIR